MLSVSFVIDRVTPKKTMTQRLSSIKFIPLGKVMIVVLQHGGGEGLGEGQEEVNTQGEVVRQKEYLERTLLSLKNQLSQAGAEGPNHFVEDFY